MKNFAFTLIAFLFTAINSFAADYFWVGGSGNWSDYSNHWATTSGGSTFHTIAPTSNDNVFFDATSFSSSGETVIVDAEAYCHDFDWTGATNDPVFAGTQYLHCSGSFTLIPDLTFSWSGRLYFESISTGETITTAGNQFNNHVYFDGLGGWEFQDDFSTLSSRNIYFYNGSINTNSFNISTNSISSYVTNPRSLTLGSSEITLFYSSSNALYINNTSFTLNAGTSLIRLINNGGGITVGGTGNLNFNNVSGESVSGTNYVNCNGGSFNVIDIVNNGVLNYDFDADTILVSGDITMYSNHNFNYINVSENATIYGNNTFGEAILQGNTSFTGDNSFNTLELSQGKTYTFTNGKTQTIGLDLIANGTCSEPITLQSSSQGSQSSISKSSGIITITYCILKDQNATGGATFYANNSIDEGNNTGWTVNPPAPQNLYWIGGTGDWNDPAHWSTTSGGSGGACIPSSIDNVYFDANSFSSSGQTVTAIGDGANNVNCKSMSWAGVTYNPTFAGANNLLLNVFGSFTLSANMTWSFGGKIYFKSDNPGNTLTTAGHILNLNDMYFDRAGGGWSLNDDLNVGDEYIYLNSGSFSTNNFNIIANRFISTTTNVRALYLGSSEITLTYSNSSAFRVTKTNLTFDAGTSLIKLQTAGGGINCDGTGTLDFYNVVCEATTGTSAIYNANGSFNTILFNSAGTLYNGFTVDSVWFMQNASIYSNGYNINYAEINGTAIIQGNSTYDKLILKDNASFTGDNTITTVELAEGKTYTFSYNKTQTILSDIIANGTCIAPITIQSNYATYQSTFSKSSGTINIDYCILQNIIATGGASFIANNSLDMGGNTGWIINPPAPLNLYWVGGTGNWDDPSHWALTSGGSGGTCIPTSIDNVFFDANSFNATGQTVTLTGDGNNNASCNSMDWTGAANNPGLSGASIVALRVYGSLILNANMNFNFNGKIYFNSTNSGNLIETYGIVMDLNDIYFDGIGGGWSLMDPIDMGDEDIYLVNGSLTTNNHQITARRFLSNYTNSRTLNLGTSTVVLSYGGSAFYVNGTNLTFSGSNSRIRCISPNGGLSVIGYGYLTLNNIYCEAVTGNSTVSNDNGIINNIVFSSNGTFDGYVSVDSVITAGNLTVYDNNNVNYVLCNGDANIYGASTYDEMILKGNASIHGNNIFNTLELTAGGAYTFDYGKQQTFNTNLIANGTPTDLIVIQSSSSGNQTTFSKSTGTVLVNYVSLQDNNAIGGASFIANNSIDLGNNYGWTITSGSGTDYYWVGGTGDWNDISNWAASSGGTGGAGLPTILDNVYFDANSFSTTGEIVTIIGDAANNANCKNMDWTGALYNPTLAGASTQTLNIYGSLVLNPSMTYNFDGPVVFAATSTGNTITTNGIDFTENHIYFDGIGGEWTLMDELNATGKYIYFYNGSLITNNYNINAHRFFSDQMNTRSLNLGSSDINLTYPGIAFIISNNGMTLNAGTSLIRLTGSSGGISITGGTPVDLYDVVVENTGGTSNITNQYGTIGNIFFNNNGRLYGVMTIDSAILNQNADFYGNATIDYAEVHGTSYFSGSTDITEIILMDDAQLYSSNIFGTIELAPGHTYTLAYNQTQTIETDMIANGTCIEPITLESSYAGVKATISKSSGTITINRVQLKDQNAIGGATFIANNSVDLGNNSGWTINAVSPQNLYWVGGTGNWSDVNHWAATSGGSGGYCLPTAFDNVYFDANSFYQESQAVYIDVADVSCADMDWTGAAHNPTFAMNSNTYNLHVNGSLTLIPAMNFTITGKIYFESASKSGNKATKTITTAGQEFLENIYFDGSGQEWILQDALNISNDIIYLNRGILNTNDQNVYCSRFISNVTNDRSLILGSSTVNLYSTSLNAWQVGGTLMVLDAGSSDIRILSSNAGMLSTGGAILQYNRVSFVAPSGKATLNSDDEFAEVEFFGNGEVKGNGTFSLVTFHFDGTINNNNTFGNVYMQANGFLNGSNTYSNLFFTPGYTYTLQAGYWQTILYDLVAIGTCADQITINSDIPGVRGVLRKTSGNITINFVYLQDNEAIGGATFEAYNSVDNGNNVGWSIYPEGPKDIYWVGGSGDWLDISHWAFSSGGTGNYCMPGPEDNVIFDANSFDAPGQTVIIDDPAVEFNSMTWTVVTNNPTIIGYASYFEMYINGSLTLDPNMNFDFEGEIFFQGGGAKEKGSYNLTSAGHQFNNNIYFEGAGQEWTIQDPLDLGDNILNFVEGTLNTAGQPVHCKQFYSFYSNNRTLNLGSSGIYLSDETAFDWDVNGTNMTLNAGTSIIYLTSKVAGFRSVFGNNLVYHQVESVPATGSSMIYTDHQINTVNLNNDAEITGGGTFGTVNFNKNGVINNSNTFSYLDLENGFEYTFEAGQTQTIVNNINMTASACYPIYIHSDTEGSQALISKSSGLTGSYLYVKDMNATGGVVVNCSNSFDLGNNTNWNFIANPGYDFNLTVFLEGAFNGTDMNTDLLPYLPNDHPYNTAPWNYSTCQTAPVFPANAVDWVLVELRDAQSPAQATPATSIAKIAGFLLDDGSIVGGDGASPLRINVSPTFNLYAVIWHRNHLGIMSSVPLTLSGGIYSYDFTTSLGKAYLNGQTDLGGGKYGMYAGDADGNGMVHQNDIDNVWSNDAGSRGYYNGDLNLNSETDNRDKNDVWLPNINKSDFVPD